MWNIKQHADRYAIIDELNNKLTYAELDAEMKKLSNVIGKREFVISLCKNSIGSVIGYLSFVEYGIVPMMLSASMDELALKNILEIYKPSYIYLPTQLLENKVIDDVEVVYSTYDYSLVRTSYGVEHEIYDELALLLTTSGSTGSPKFVRQSYKNIIENTKSIVNYLGLDENERPITTLPMNYTYGLSIINTHISVGATILITDKSLMQKEFWNFFKTEKATSFGGVPYTYEILKKLRFMRMDLPSLKTMTQAGGKITPELHLEYANYARDNGKRFVVMYGQCEATARMGYLPADKAIEKCGSMGIAIPGGSFLLVDDAEKEISEAGVPGELVYTGPNVTLGYAECIADLAKGDERKGVLHTGDIAQFDEDGYYYIVGRKKRFLKIYGNRVNLDETERLIKSKFSDIDCACGGVDDCMHIFVVGGQYISEIKEYVVAKTKLNPVAFKVIEVDKIPKNEAGKVLYKELHNFIQRNLANIK